MSHTQQLLLSLIRSDYENELWDKIYRYKNSFTGGQVVELMSLLSKSTSNTDPPKHHAHMMALVGFLILTPAFRLFVGAPTKGGGDIPV
jgi:hypothetical protein